MRDIVLAELRTTKLEKLDDDEIDDILSHIDFGDFPELIDEVRDALLPFVRDQASRAADGVGEASGATVDELLAMTEQANEAAIAYAESTAAELVTQITEATRNEMRALLTEGVSDGATVDELASDVTNAYGFSEERSRLIARTETSFAENRGTLAGWKASGLVEGTEWLPDVDPCPICQDNADEGVVPIGEEYPSGDEAAPAHPNCECTNLAVIGGVDGTEDDVPVEEEEEAAA